MSQRVQKSENPWKKLSLFDVSFFSDTNHMLKHCQVHFNSAFHANRADNVICSDCRQIFGLPNISYGHLRKKLTKNQTTI